MGFCKYSGILGEPGKGFHKHVFGIAIGDVIGTILLAVVIYYIVKKIFPNVTRKIFWIILLILFILGIILHKLFCVNTTINRLISRALS